MAPVWRESPINTAIITIILITHFFAGRVVSTHISTGKQTSATPFQPVVSTSITTPGTVAKIDIHVGGDI